MCSRKLPLHRRMEVPEDETKHKRIERTPVGVDNLVQTTSRHGPGDFDVGNAIGGYVIAVRPHAQQSQSQNHAPKENSRLRLGRRACRRKWIPLFCLRASQMMHSSSAAKI